MFVRPTDTDRDYVLRNFNLKCTFRQISVGLFFFMCQHMQVLEKQIQYLITMSQIQI